MTTEDIICCSYDSYKAQAEGLILLEIEFLWTTGTETIIGCRWDSNEIAAESWTKSYLDVKLIAADFIITFQMNLSMTSWAQYCGCNSYMARTESQMSWQLRLLFR